MLKTPLCDLLQIEYPIIQGGMAWVADGTLAAAVSEGGGLGLIAAMNAGPAWLLGEIKKARSLTKKPFGVNIMLQSPFAAQAAEIVIVEKIPVVTTGAGSPRKYIPRWLEAGIKVIPVIPSALIALAMEKAGATAVIAEGAESGGHIGEMNTMALVPQVCDAVKIPVIAAGGIGDGRGIAAALMLGAVGVQAGTRFLLATETNIHPNYKKKIIKATDLDTIATGKRLGHPVRALKNKFTRDYFAKEYDSTVSPEELGNLGAGALRLAAQEGDESNGCFMAGQIAGMLKEELPAAEILRRMSAEAEEILKVAGKWIK